MQLTHDGVRLLGNHRVINDACIICGLWRLRAVAWRGRRTNGRANRTWQRAAARAPSRREAAGYSGISASSVVEARRPAVETAAALRANLSTRDSRRRRSSAVPLRCSSPSRQWIRRRRRPAPSRSDGRRVSTEWCRSASCRPLPLVDVQRLQPAVVEAVPPAHRSSTKNSTHRHHRYLLQTSTSSWRRRDSRPDYDMTRTICYISRIKGIKHDEKKKQKKSQQTTDKNHTVMHKILEHYSLYVRN